MTTEDDVKKKLDDLNEKKDVAFFQAGITAWYNTSLEHDKSLFTLSVGGIGLLMTLIRTVGVSSAETLVLYILAMVSFLVCLVAVLVIFKKNRSHIEQILKSSQEIDKNLAVFDNVAIWSFGIAVLFSAVIGISSAISSYTTKVTQMAKENDKQTLSNIALDSVNGISKLAPEKLGASFESFYGIVNLQPQSTANQPTQAASTTSNTSSSQTVSSKKGE